MRWNDFPLLRNLQMQQRVFQQNWNRVGFRCDRTNGGFQCVASAGESSKCGEPSFAAVWMNDSNAQICSRGLAGVIRSTVGSTLSPKQFFYSRPGSSRKPCRADYLLSPSSLLSVSKSSMPSTSTSSPYAKLSDIEASSSSRRSLKFETSS